MSDYKSLLINIFCHTILLVCLTSFQTSLWFDFFGSLTPPFMAIPILVFFTLYRDFKDGMIFCICSSFIISNFTVGPHGLLLSLLLGIFLLISKLKTRIYWDGSSYFVSLTAISNFLFLFMYYLISWSFEKQGFASILVLDWFLQILFTSIVAPACLILCLLLDRFLGKEQNNPMEESF